MKIREELVDILVDVSPEIYSNYVLQEKGHCVLYVHDGVIITVLEEVL